MEQIFLSLTWESVQPALINWWYAEEIARVADGQDWRHRLQKALRNYLNEKSMVNRFYLGEVLNEKGFKTPDLKHSGADFAPVLMGLALKHLDDGNIGKLDDIFERKENALDETDNDIA